LKILLVNYEYPPLGGGAANGTMFIGKVLAELGHEPTATTSAFGTFRSFATASMFGAFAIRKPISQIK
jgi:hypothetical protein